jgi:hypothetical protein
MSLKDMMSNLRDGLGIRKIRKLGPLGQAVEVLNKVLKAAIDGGKYDSSPTFKAVHVVVDHCRVSREALEAATAYVSWMESKPELTEQNKKVSDALELEFKTKALRARLHQYVPFDKLPLLGPQKQGNPPS